MVGRRPLHAELKQTAGLMTTASMAPCASPLASRDAGMTVGMAPKRARASASIALLARIF